MENDEKYTKEKVTINLYWANIFAILLLIPTAVAFGLPFYLVWRNEILLREFTLGSSWIVLLVLILGTIAHELIHGVTLARFTKSGFKSIKFGVMWKMITPYCHCKEPLKLRQYLLGGIMPAIVLGFIPAILATIFGNLALLMFGMFFTFAAGGDFLMILALRNEKKDTLVEDHPSEAGCYVYRLNQA